MITFSYKIRKFATFRDKVTKNIGLHNTYRARPAEIINIKMDKSLKTVMT